MKLLNIFFTFSLIFIFSCSQPIEKNTDINFLKKQMLDINTNNMKKGVLVVQNKTSWDYMLITEAYASCERLKDTLELEEQVIDELKNNLMKYELRQIYLIKNGKIFGFEPITKAFKVSEKEGILILSSKVTAINYKYNKNAYGNLELVLP
jgi:hypothetical protein